MVIAALHIAAKTLVGYRRMRALIEALIPLDQFKILAAHSAAIMAFKLAALSSSLSLAGNASLRGYDDVVN